MTFSNSIGKKTNGLAILPIGTSAGNTGELQLRELAANGTNYVGVKSPDSLASTNSYTLPAEYPDADGQLLSSTTTGTMSWTDPATTVNRNVIKNPEMIIAQRGTSFSAVPNTTYTIDQYKTAYVTSAVIAISQSSTVPTVAAAGYLARNSLQLTITSNDTSIAAGDHLGILQYIEGYDFATIAQQEMTFSFWVRSSLTGTYCIAFRNSGLDRSYIAEYTINSANTWEKKIITIAASPSAGTWDYTSGIGLQVCFLLMSGSTFQTTANTWQTGNFLATSNQVNFAATNSNSFYITMLKLEKGNTATQFEGVPIAEELTRCQRYLFKTFNLNTAPASNTETSLRASGFSTVAAGGTSVFPAIYLPVRMRTAPSISTYNPYGAGSEIANSTLTSTGTALYTANPSSVSLVFVVPSGGAVGANFGVHIVASAEL